MNGLRLISFGVMAYVGATGTFESGSSEANIDTRCVDDRSYRAPQQGLPCEAYSGLACNDLGRVGFTKDSVEELLFHCPKSCKVPECGPTSMVHSSPTISLSTTAKGGANHTAYTIPTRGLRQVASKSPTIFNCRNEDDPLYRSPQGGAACDNYAGMDCTRFTEIGFSQLMVYKLTRSCPVSCGMPCGAYTLEPSASPSGAPSLSMEPTSLSVPLPSSQTSLKTPPPTVIFLSVLVAATTLVLLIKLYVLRRRKVDPLADAESRGALKGSSSSTSTEVTPDTLEQSGLEWEASDSMSTAEATEKYKQHVSVEDGSVGIEAILVTKEKNKIKRFVGLVLSKTQFKRRPQRKQLAKVPLRNPSRSKHGSDSIAQHADVEGPKDRSPEGSETKNPTHIKHLKHAGQGSAMELNARSISTKFTKSAKKVMSTSQLGFDQSAVHLPSIPEESDIVCRRVSLEFGSEDIEATIPSDAEPALKTSSPPKAGDAENSRRKIVGLAFTKIPLKGRSPSKLRQKKGSPLADGNSSNDESKREAPNDHRGLSHAELVSESMTERTGNPSSREFGTSQNRSMADEDRNRKQTVCVECESSVGVETRLRSPSSHSLALEENRKKVCVECESLGVETRLRRPSSLSMALEESDVETRLRRPSSLSLALEESETLKKFGAHMRGFEVDVYNMIMTSSASQPSPDIDDESDSGEVSTDSKSMAKENEKLKQLVSRKYGAVTAEAIMHSSSTLTEENDRLNSFVNLLHALEAENIKLVVTKSNLDQQQIEADLSSFSESVASSVESIQEELEKMNNSKGIFPASWFSLSRQNGDKTDSG